MTRVLVIDNYDSFTYNLVQLLGEQGVELEVVRNDRASVAELLSAQPDLCVVSPGPCTPNEAGITLEAIRAFPEAGIPTLGVCLGHQALAQAFGGTVIRHVPVHGKIAEIEHDGTGLYAGLPQPAIVGRYHSLVVEQSSLPDCFEITSREITPNDDGVIQGIRHRELPVEGVQFHPESVLTPDGRTMLANFLARA